MDVYCLLNFILKSHITEVNDHCKPFYVIFCECFRIP